MISLIAAIGKNYELGKGNALLWSLPADMKHFRDTTRAHTVIMGRKTFESLGRSPTGEPIGRPLPQRRNIVITRDADYKKEGIEVANSLGGALSLISDSSEEIFVIGGAEIYKQALPVADKLYITHVGASFPDADAFFPEIIPIAWNEIRHIEHGADDKNPYPYTFSVYEKFI